MSNNADKKLDAVSARLLFHKRHGRIYFEKAEECLRRRNHNVRDADFVRFEDAAYFFFKSSISYMACSRWREAGESLECCAQMRVRLKMKAAAAATYTQAAEAFLKADKDAAIGAYESAIGLYVDLAKFDCAGALERKLADTHFANKHWEEAAEHFKRAGNFFSNEIWRDQSDLCFEREAQCYVFLGDFFLEEAAQIYERIAISCTRSNLRRFNARDYLFRASLCYAAIPMPSASEEEDSSALDDEMKTISEEKYTNVIWKIHEFEALDFMWRNSKEASFLLNIMYFRLDWDEDEIADHIFYWNNVEPLDRVCLKLLRVIVDEVREELKRQAEKKKRQLELVDKKRRRKERFEKKKEMMSNLGVDITEDDVAEELDKESDDEQAAKSEKNLKMKAMAANKTEEEMLAEEELAAEDAANTAFGAP